MVVSLKRKKKHLFFTVALFVRVPEFNIILIWILYVEFLCVARYNSDVISRLVWNEAVELKLTSVILLFISDQITMNVDLKQVCLIFKMLVQHPFTLTASLQRTASYGSLLASVSGLAICSKNIPAFSTVISSPSPCVYSLRILIIPRHGFIQSAAGCCCPWLRHPALRRWSAVKLTAECVSAQCLWCSPDRFPRLMILL